jgi:hypothetical protein
MDSLDISKLQEVKFSDLLDPFSSKYVEDVSINISKDGHCTTMVSFVNGNTCGSHLIEADSPKEMGVKIDNFFANMKNHG